MISIDVGLFRQTRTFDSVRNLTPWLSQMLIYYHSNPDNRRLLQEMIIHIIDSCSPLVDACVCRLFNLNFHNLVCFQNVDRPISTSAGSLLYSLIPVTRQHLSLDQVNSIKHLIHRTLIWTVQCNSKANFQVNFHYFSSTIQLYTDHFSSINYP